MVDFITFILNDLSNVHCVGLRLDLLVSAENRFSVWLNWWWASSSPSGVASLDGIWACVLAVEGVNATVSS